MRCDNLKLRVPVSRFSVYMAHFQDKQSQFLPVHSLWPVASLRTWSTESLELIVWGEKNTVKSEKKRDV